MSEGDRLARLTARVAALEQRLDEAESEGSAAEPAVADSGSRDPFWALNALKERYPAPGAVSYTGSVDVGGGHLEYQWDRPTEAVLAADWATRSERLAALAHPLRLAILRLLLDQECTVAQLVDELQLGSTGVAYHHLHQLQSEGWVTSPRRGVWSVPGGRVVPLLAIIIATEEA